MVSCITFKIYNITKNKKYLNSILLFILTYGGEILKTIKYVYEWITQVVIKDVPVDTVLLVLILSVMIIHLIMHIVKQKKERIIIYIK
jgi:hypothetical protein